MKKATGCGCAVLAVVVVTFSLLAWVITSFEGKPYFDPSQPLPKDVPPAAGEAVPRVDIHAPGRTANQLRFWSDPIAKDTGVSSQAIAAYGNAELIAAESWPTCHISWNTLAGIGYVETRHGTYSGKVFSGSHLTEDGVATPPIIGVPLDGSPGVASIPDTDGGELDGDTEYDRAVGPMQFIPETWRRYGRDANGDGIADPNQIDDSALSAANLLCDKGGDLSTPAGWTAAIQAYNMSNEYLVKVRNAAAAYALRQPA